MSAALSFNPRAGMTEAEKAVRKAAAKAYLDGLEYGCITEYGHERFSDTFTLFSTMFHTDGKPWITRQRFSQLFGFNTDETFQKNWGPLCYAMTYAYDATKGKVVGGAIHASMIPPENVRQEGHVDVLYMGGYIFSAPESRGFGLASRLIEVREQQVRDYARSVYAGLGMNVDSPRLLGFNEQNNPLLMTPAEIRDDIAKTGITPWGRLSSSRKHVGWRLVDADFRYLEPDRLGDAGVDYLSLGVKAEIGVDVPREIPASVLMHFLRHYTALRRDGVSPDQDQKYRQQIADLQLLRILHPVNDGPTYERLAPRFDTLAARASAGSLPERDMDTRVEVLFAREDAMIAQQRAGRPWQQPSARNRRDILAFA